MGFRFRKSKKLLPGVRLNVGKKAVLPLSGNEPVTKDTIRALRKSISKYTIEQ
jgi:hypothetical protein